MRLVLSTKKEREFLEDHIIYRASILQAGIDSIDGKLDHLDIGIRNACFEGCAIMVRIFMEFFGLRVDKAALKSGKRALLYGQKPTKLFEDTEVYVGLFKKGKFISNHQVNKHLEKQLIEAYLIGDRAAAHFTHYPKGEGGSGDTTPVNEAARFLLEMLQKNLYDQYSNVTFSTTWKKPYERKSKK